MSDFRVNPATYDDFAFRFVSECGHPEIIELLFSDAPVNPAADNTDNDLAFRLARVIGM